jgi:hypothetical protein
VSHLPTFTLTVNGLDFVPDARIVFNGIEKTTEYVSPTQLTCQIEPDDIAAAVSVQNSGNSISPPADSTKSVKVRNPAPGGGDSNVLDFTVYDNFTFTAPVGIASGGASYHNPALAVDDSGSIFVVYEYADTVSSTYAIDFIRSSDGGRTWETPVRIVSYTGNCKNPCIALDSGGGIDVAFYVGGQVYFTRSTDNGVTWSLPMALSTNTIQFLEPVIVVDAEDGICIAWTQEDTGSRVNRVYFTRSVDFGSSWSVPLNIFAGFDNSSNAYNLAAAVDGNRGVYATWTSWPVGGSRYSYVYANYSLDNGNTWSTTDSYFGVCASSDIAVAPDGTVNLVLANAYIPFAYEIVLRQSTDRGANWGDRIEITNNRYDWDPQLVIDIAGNINVIYNYNSSFYFSRSTDNGVTWSPEIPVSAETSVIDMAVDSAGNLNFVYELDTLATIHFFRSS